MTNYMANEGARAADSGFHVFPCYPSEKFPGTYSDSRGWEHESKWERFCERPATELEIEHWSAWPDAGVCIACGPVVGVDIDIEDHALALKVREVATRVLGDTPLIRYGRRPRMMMVYRAERPMREKRLGPLVVLGLGRQFVGFGIHPVSGQPYEWEDGTPAEITVDELPGVSEGMVQNFLDEAIKELPLAMRATRARKADHVPGFNKGELSTREAISSALRFIPTDGADYKYFLDIGMGIHEALGGDGLDLWDDWCAGSPHYNPDGLDKKWHSFGSYSGDRISAGTIFAEAQLRGWHPEPGIFLTQREKEWASQPHPAQALLDSIAAMATVPLPVTGGATGAPEDRDDERRALSAREEMELEAGLPDPDWLVGLGGGLEMFVRRCLSTARKPQPWITLGAAISLFGSVMGRRYAGPTGLRPNTYIIGLADSSAGKGHPQKWVRQCLQQAELGIMLGGEDIASGQGMISQLEYQPRTLWVLDEVDGLLRAALSSDSRAPAHLTQISRNLLSLYSKPDEIYTGTNYASRKDRPPVLICQPHANIFGATTPEKFWSAFRSGSALDGTLGRMLIFESDVPYPYSRTIDGSTVMPADIIELLKAINKGVPGHDHFPMGDGPGMSPNPYIVPWGSQEAREFFNNLGLQETRLSREKEGRPDKPLYGRMCEQVMKLALIRAVATEPELPQIRLSDLQWATKIYHALTITLVRGVGENVADTQYEVDVNRIGKAVREATDKDPNDILLTELSKRTRWCKSRDRRDILIHLTESGLVRATTNTATGGAPTTRYIWTYADA